MNWESYNKYVLNRIKELLNESKPNYCVDMHIHTIASPDAENKIFEHIYRAKRLGFDIISISDHDSINSFYEFQKIKQYDMLNDLPIVIPAIEISANCQKYDGLCHILKYFININSKELAQLINTNEKSFWERAKKQFVRINENNTLKYFSNAKGCYFSFEEYSTYINCNKTIPDYINLMEYIYSKLKEKSITIKNVYEKTYDDCLKDTCKERREKRIQVLNRYKIKYQNSDLCEHSKALLSLLAPVGIDDSDYPKYKSTGSLTINNYGNIPIESIKDISGVTVWAHPTRQLIENIDADILSDLEIKGLEINKCNWRTNENDIKNYVQKNNMFYTIGSDTHSVFDDSYQNLDFFTYEKEQLEKFYIEAYKTK